MAGNIIWLICVWGCAALFTGIGIFAGKKDSPANFWSGTVVKKEAVNDIKGYNKAMKRMWCIYSVPFWITGIGYFISETVSVLVIVVASTVGIGWLIWKYKCIEKHYVNSEIVEEDNKEYLKKSKTTLYFSAIITTVTIVLIGFLLFTGDVVTTLDEDLINVKGSFWSNYSVDYDTINYISIEKNIDLGHRKNGIGSIKLSEGSFSNDEFDDYKLYVYNKCDTYIVMNTDKGIVVINDKTEKKTQELYNNILDKLAE